MKSITAYHPKSEKKEKPNEAEAIIHSKFHEMLLRLTPVDQFGQC